MYKKLNFRLFIIFLATFFTAQLSYAKIEISLDPQIVAAGEPATLSISSTDGKAVIPNLPKIANLKWIEPDLYASSISIINGVRYEITSYTFVVSKKGRIELPSLAIYVDGEQYNTKAISLSVISSPLADLEQKIYLKPEYMINKNKEIYIGEKLPLKIYVYIAESISARPVEYPQIKLRGIVFEDFSQINRENVKFARYPYLPLTRVTINGISYIKTCFYTSYRSIITGEISGKISLMLGITLPNRNSKSPFFDNNAFNLFLNSDSFFNRGKRVSKIIEVDLPKLKIIPLPKVPKNINYIGLLGEWKTNISLSTKKLKEGEPLTVKIELTGKGSLESLKTPTLSIPGFTAYPPEINKDEEGSLMFADDDKVTIEYVLIPTERGSNKINISFATFNTESGEYNISKINTSIEVTKNNFSTKSTVYSNRNNITPKFNKAGNSKGKINNFILYLDKNISSDVKIPLYKNHLILILLFFILGPLFWFLFIIYRIRDNKINKSTKGKRKHNAIKRHNNIIKKIKKSSPENINETVNNSVIPFINDIKGFAPGTTVEEITKNISDKELSECLEEINLSRYMPNENMTNDQLKTKLYKCIKRMSFILVLGIFSILPHTIHSATTSGSDLNKMVALYNSGKFTQAEKICSSNIKSNAPNPIWLYNSANCYFQNGNLTKALVLYERALLLAPHNSNILKNLNYVRYKLYLPERYTISTPKTFLIYIRDLFRPDEWLLIVSICFFATFIGLISKYYVPKKLSIILILICSIIGIISATALINQKYTIYNSKNAVILFNDIDVYSLPSVNSLKAELNLTAGEQIKIEEKMDNWIRIRTSKSEGWIKYDNIERIWPYQ